VKTKRGLHKKPQCFSEAREINNKSVWLMPYAIYILKCSDGTYYTGLTKELEARIHQHKMGVYPESYREAFQWERKIKGWSRAKKEALISGDIEGIHEIVKKERKRREKNKKDTSR
jgi:putative endonuclease